MVPSAPLAAEGVGPAADTAASGSVGRLALALTFWAVTVLALAGWYVFSNRYLEDDAFIHLTFARSLAEGRGFAFGGLVTNGDTAPLWVLLLVAVHALGAGWTAAAKLLCVLGLVGCLAALWRIVRDLVAEEREGQWLAIAAVTLTAINPYFLDWSFAGMEPVTAMGVSLWALWAAFIAAPTYPRLLLAAALLGAGPLLRPEMLLLAAVTGPVVLWKAWRLSAHAPLTPRLLRVALLALVLALPVVLWSAYALHTFGAIVPNTNLAKRGGSLALVVPRIAAVYLFGYPVTLVLVPYALIQGWRLRARLPSAVWVLLLWPLLCAVFYVADHTAVQTRYSVLTMPTLGIGILILIHEARHRWLKRSVLAAMGLAALVTVCLAVVPHVKNKMACTRAYAEVSTFIRSHVPADAPVLAYAIGQVELETRHPLIDSGGITRPSVIPFLGDQRAIVRWAKAQGAQYAISGGAPPEPGAVRVFHTTVPYLGWTFSPAQWRTVQALDVYKLAGQGER